MTLTVDNPQSALSVGWWLEVGTTHPLQISYFGPFEDRTQAECAKHEYLEDFETEKANIVYARAKLCQPRKRLINENELTIEDLRVSPVTFFEALVMR
ncbi:DUF1816 domain-containing protein [Altericista sp. CCNU0014]|uniref:DUF1816 domain-containing protein n=1 Tax=Altericista sp. CCNU0014 TaxID=3082949 RepID=UPI00384C5123